MNIDDTPTPPVKEHSSRRGYTVLGNAGFVNFQYGVLSTQTQLGKTTVELG